MKNLLRKSWFIGVIISGLLLMVFLLNLWIMSLKLVSPYSADSFWSLAGEVSYGDALSVFAFSFKVAFYASLVPLVLSGISLYKKNNWGLLTAALFFLVFETSFIVFQTLEHYLTVFALILTILNILLIIAVMVMMVLRSKVLVQSGELPKSLKPLDRSDSKMPRIVLIIDIVAIVVFLTTFLFPLYAMLESGSTYNAILINVLLSSDTHITSIIFFFIDFAMLLAMLVYFANSLSLYFFDKERFINQSRTLVTFAFIATLIFFLTGLSMDIYYTISDVVSQTNAYTPLLMMVAVVFAYSIIEGKYRHHYQIDDKKIRVKYPRIEPLFYVILLTAISTLMLLLPIISYHITVEGYTYDANLTGFNILRDYGELDPGYRIVAFILVVLLISVGLALVIGLSGYLSKYKRFNSIVKSVAGVNVFFVFLVAISGYYFQIAQEINQVIVEDVFDFYGIYLPHALEYDYTIGTTAVYALIASVIVLILMFVRKAFDRDELEIDSFLMNNGGVSTNEESTTLLDEDEYRNFDPCPAFTELDLRVEEFHQDLDKRKELQVHDHSLNDLIYFVVEYARNSPLHLSYTPEDIATFVAGLGASRLSILQGMSGTGKTSLPKIFSEAIYGNCDIIEVESSWKDKNELLGYYNEFSTKYTPKKFTLALYKAALNKEIATFILLDEMNLSRIEYYFSDFLSLMENEEGYREIKLVNIKLSRTEEEKEVDYQALTNGHTLKVPTNVWFIGTANRDESTFVISDKVYDRAHTMNFTKRAPKVRNFSNPISKQYYDYQTINNLFKVAKENGDFDAENNPLIKSVEALLAPFNISFGNRILKQIEDFVNIYKACFADIDVENVAIEKILLSKVVAKLEVKTIDDKEKLELEFEKLKLYQCLDFIKRLDND